MAGYAITDPKHIADVLRSASQHRELMVLSTPYMRVESMIVKVEESVFHAANGGCQIDDIRHGLKTDGLKMCFPHQGRFFEGPTSLVGLGMHQGSGTIRFKLPSELKEEDKRGAYRTDRVAKIDALLVTPKSAIVTASLVNLSVSGVRFRSHLSLDNENIQEGSKIHVTFSVTKDIQIDTHALVRYIKGRIVGLEFTPLLHGKPLERLGRWIFQRREEALQSSMMLSGSSDAIDFDTLKLGVILLSCDTEVADHLRTVCAGGASMHVVPPGAQVIKGIASASGKLFVILHVKDGSADAQKRMQAMLEPLKGKVPVMVLGTGASVDSNSIAEMAQGLHAAGTHLMNLASPNPLLPRIIRGLWNRHCGE